MSLRFFSVTSAGLWLDHEFEIGATGLLGSSTDGGEQVLALANGSVRPERGVVSLDHTPAFDHPRTRAAVGTLSPQEWAPAGATALEWMAQLQGLHRQATSSAPAEQCLSDLGLSSLRKQLMGDLSPDQRRGVALAVALGLDAPRLLTLSTPFEVRSVSQAAVHERLTAHARRCIVLFTTTQQDDVSRLGAGACVFAGKRCVGRWDSGEEGPAQRVVCYRVTCEPAAKMYAALLAQPAVRSVQAPVHRGTLQVIGNGAEATSLAILETANQHGITLHDMFEAPLELDALQASMRGHTDAAYQTALQTTQSIHESSATAPESNLVRVNMTHSQPAPTGGQRTGEAAELGADAPPSRTLTEDPDSTASGASATTAPSSSRRSADRDR